MMSSLVNSPVSLANSLVLVPCFVQAFGAVLAEFFTEFHGLHLPVRELL